MSLDCRRDECCQGRNSSGNQRCSQQVVLKEENEYLLDHRSTPVMGPEVVDPCHYEAPLKVLSNLGTPGALGTVLDTSTCILDWPSPQHPPAPRNAAAALMALSISGDLSS
eukprot:CAMPEP_0170573920 /NCGR_PEP_ID=MMETSP0224-20130122/3023_1 /TAXON_ID=285029 /ORGANISM="Togula jolla, Strain CCCM 725" /LENGTH=110 /DNA_ID=CAMNT_0010896541 /DNA_START=1140 /DNA_END=1473 /DNA_ORIENTATION=-